MKTEELAEAACVWLCSEEGLKKLAEVMQKCDEACEEMEEQRKIHWIDLNRPMTI